MAITYGFYNSINKDRTYNAIQISQIFDGVINDGIYMSVLNHFAVRAGGGMNVIIGGGRSWFNHTWTYNDSDMAMTIDDSEFEANRIDAIVIKVNRSSAVRENTIEIIKGTPAVVPEKPTFVDTNDISYHPLAYVAVSAAATEITQADIENAIGVDPRTPFVTGIIETISTADLVTQWQAEWDEWNAEHRQAYLDWVATQEADMESWIATQEADMESWERAQKSSFETWEQVQKSSFETWSTGRQAAFETWFRHLQNELDDHQAAHLQNEIDLLTEDMETFKEQTTEDLEEFKEETSAELTEQTFKLAHDLCNRVTNIEYDGSSISQITSTNSDYSAVSVTTFEETEVGKNIITAVTKDGWIYTETVVINNDTHTITESYTKEEVTP